ncbi:probable staphylococcal-like nuclease CAN3 [Triticum dicoccoides]|uniref:probable staphylococcal-like nuclease CAN3 n=1 Tax=Triticum dicoccoides TaxID=85692 RepID=UPI000E7A98AF|nr:probable staphylococcal-like nuclease CAN3 [Triticum dicoccoides]
MGNTQQTGVKEDDHGGGGNQLFVFLDQVLAGVAENPLAGGHDFEATSMLKNCRINNTDAYGGGISSRSRTSRRGRRPVPEGVQFVLNTLPVDPSCIGDGDGFTAHVMEMAGDTNNRAPKQCRIRMRGIDAPELNMEYGKKSKKGLVKLIGEKCVEIHVYGMDHFDRYIGDIYCDGVFIQEQMLKRGLAWHFKKYDKRPEFAQWEREAKMARVGLWISDNPQTPWDWRRDHPMNKKKENADDIQGPTPAVGDVKAGGGVSMTDKNMNTNYATLAGAVAGLSAIGAGLYLMSKPKKTEEVVDD